MSKFICKVCGEKEPCVLEMGNDQDGFRPVCCPVDNTSGIKPEWHPVDEPSTSSSQLPKLTAEVFDRPDCPDWAKWAAVDMGGKAFWYASHPVLSNEAWLHLAYKRIFGDLFDYSDWQNSLIERPAKLPDWCKVGEWVWVKSAETYEQIEEIEGRNIICGTMFFDVGAIGKTVFEARLRPFNAEEMRGLVGKVLTSNSRSTSFSFLVVYAEGDGSFIESYRFKYTAEELKDHFTIDGSPCGVLEHLENGEWVE